MRLVADTIRGKAVSDARTSLHFLNKKASVPLRKLIDSAVANARENDQVSDEDSLFIKEIRVDEGFTLKRFMPRAMGRATRINKRTSHISIVLDKKSTPVTASETK